MDGTGITDDAQWTVTTAGPFRVDSARPTRGPMAGQPWTPVDGWTPAGPGQ
jgi:hypothetical protein